MDSRFPNEDERRKLQKLARYYKLLPIYVLSVVGLFWIIASLLDQYPLLVTVVTVIVFVAIIYLLINFAILKRCPRCSSWGTPVLGGNCPKCGMYLDSSLKEI